MGRTLQRVLIAVVLLAPACTARSPDGSSSGSPGDTTTDLDAGTPDAAVTVTPDAGTPDAAAPEPLLVDGLQITRVVVFQAVAVPVWQDRRAVSPRNAPLIAGRDAVVRIFVGALPSWTPRTVTAELSLVQSSGAVDVLQDTRTPVLPAVDGDPQSGFSVNISGNLLEATTQFSVRLTDVNGTAAAPGSNHAAHVPAVGALLDLGAVRTWPLKLHLVPVRYDRDGSRRLPDTSDTQLQRIRDALTAFYPLLQVDITVGDPLAWNTALLAGDVNFYALNDAISARKDADAPAPDVYYYGLISPASSLAAYCVGGCVTGQSYAVDDPLDAAIRLGAGMGFGTEESVLTLVHEVGHMHGRYHAPCGTNGGDVDFPYADGSIGVWGWDPRSAAFEDPAVATDFMGYCDAYWVSDYTYAALYQRIEFLGLHARPGHPVTGSWPRIHVTPQGEAAWGTTRNGQKPHGSGVIALEALDAHGRTIGSVPAVVTPFSHGGATLWLDPLLPGTHRVKGVFNGQTFNVLVPAPDP